MKITNPILSTFHLSSNGRNPLLRGDQWAYQSWLDIRSPWLPHLSYLLAASLLTILPIPEFMSTTFTRPLGSWWTPMDQNLRVSCLGSFLAVKNAYFGYHLPCTSCHSLSNILLGLYGHSAVYHPNSSAIYVFGGMEYQMDKSVITNRLYALSLNLSPDSPMGRWNLLPPEPST